MWPFGDGLSSAPMSKDDQATEDQLQKLFSDISQTEQTTSTDSGPRLAATMISNKDSPEVKVNLKEDPCSLQYYFDEFFMCYTPKSQLRNWYRYGEKKDCGERWRDFKWCMRTRMTDEETAQEMLAQHRVATEKKVHDGPNSEDVWEIRKERLTDPWDNKTQHDGLSIS